MHPSDYNYFSSELTLEQVKQSYIKCFEMDTFITMMKEEKMKPSRIYPNKTQFTPKKSAIVAEI